MPCGPALKTWTNVPDGSRLELRLRSSDDEYGQRICLKVDADPVDDWSREEVTPGPKRQDLESPGAYEVDIRLDFTGRTPTVVEVVARVFAPDGSQHGSTYRAEHTGVNGDSCESLLSIFTEGSLA